MVQYNSTMLVKRKRRCDRNHVLYYIKNVVTGDDYIGLTALSYRGNAERTIARRFLKHVQRAKAENKNWGLSKNIRKYGSESFVCEIIEVIRGKKEAHALETQLIDTYNPSLNTFKKGYLVR